MAVLILPLTMPVLIFGVASGRGGQRRHGAFPYAVPDSLRPVADARRRRAFRRRRGVARQGGVGVIFAPGAIAIRPARA